MFLFVGYLLGDFVRDIVITSELPTTDYPLSIFATCVLEIHINNEGISNSK